MKKVSITILFLASLILTSCKAEKPAKKPNIILIMADDMGFSDMGVMGGEIKTPNLDSLSKKGILYKQFYNEARCCPTRASLLTGLQPHQAGMGWMTALDLGTESYRGEINHNCVTIAEVLKSSGYNTYMTGKWHLTSDKNTKQNSDKSSWPLQRGFDHFFGTLAGEGSYYNPGTLMSQNTMIKAPANFYYTDAISDTAVSIIRKNRGMDSPFFMYVAYTAPHWPLHASRSDFEPYIDKYSVGWDSIRVMRYNRLKELGIINKNWSLPPRDSKAPAWNSLTAEEKAVETRRMAIYAAQIEVLDRGIGRIVSALKKEGEMENTLIFFLQDNGGCAEMISRKSKKLEDLGSEKSFESYRLPWANVSNTPFRLFKSWAHEGGVSTPLIVHWPDGVVSAGRVSNRIGQVQDIMATCVEVAGAKYPSEFKGHKIRKLEGESLLRSIKNEGDKRNSDLFWEHEANRAVRSGDWKLVLRASKVFPFDGKWELYNMEVDRTETNDLADTFPKKVEEMKKMWEDWAKRVNVYPLDNRPWNDRFKNPKAITEKYLKSKAEEQ